MKTAIWVLSAFCIVLLGVTFYVIINCEKEVNKYASKVITLNADLVRMKNDYELQVSCLREDLDYEIDNAKRLIEITENQSEFIEELKDELLKYKEADDARRINNFLNPEEENDT